MRLEKDTMGIVEISDGFIYGAQTQRSLNNFKIGNEKMPVDLIKALAVVKMCAAGSNRKLEILDNKKYYAIAKVCMEILNGKLDNQFPLSIYQTGSGTQTNMNINEVIANKSKLDYKIDLHPNDDVNMSQSSNDVFPTAMHISAVNSIQLLLDQLEVVVEIFRTKEDAYKEVFKLGRTHLMDATPITFAQELSAYRSAFEYSINAIKRNMDDLLELPIGGTAVGTGLNAPKDYVKYFIEELNALTSKEFRGDNNKFYGLSYKSAMTGMHSSLKTLATNTLKMCNDLRLLVSGPRGGFGEVLIPANEPGSSIMPGKVNPTQLEALSMVCIKVMGNDETITLANSLGNLQLNTYMPVMIFSFLESVRLLIDGFDSFSKNCLIGLEPNIENMRSNVENSLMLITSLNKVIGYESGAKVVKLAIENNISLKEATLQLGLLEKTEIDDLLDYKKMIGGSNGNF